MSSILITILPVFGLIAIGFASAKTRFISTNATQGLSLFVFNLALPALPVPYHDPDGTAGCRTRASVDRLFRWPDGCMDRRIDCRPLRAGIERRRRCRNGDVRDLRQCRHAGIALGRSRISARPVPFPASFIVSVHAPLLWLAATLHFETARQGHAPSILRLPQATRHRIHPQSDRSRLDSGLGPGARPELGFIRCSIARSNSLRVPAFRPPS